MVERPTVYSRCPFCSKEWRSHVEGEPPAVHVNVQLLILPTRGILRNAPRYPITTSKTAALWKPNIQGQAVHEVHAPLLFQINITEGLSSIDRALHVKKVCCICGGGFNHFKKPDSAPGYSATFDDLKVPKNLGMMKAIKTLKLDLKNTKAGNVQAAGVRQEDHLVEFQGTEQATGRFKVVLVSTESFKAKAAKKN